MRQLLVTEEACLPALDADPRPTVHQAFVVEEEEPHVVLPRVTIDMDLVTERLAGPSGDPPHR